MQEEINQDVLELQLAEEVVPAEEIMNMEERVEHHEHAPDVEVDQSNMIVESGSTILFPTILPQVDQSNMIVRQVGAEEEVRKAVGTGSGPDVMALSQEWGVMARGQEIVDTTMVAGSLRVPEENQHELQ